MADRQALFVPEEGRKYNAKEEKRWNRLATLMSRFHDMFKQQFNTVYQLADGSFSQRGLSLMRYLASAEQLKHHLEMHHTIEEAHFFPALAKRMPSFATGADAAHIKSHRAIHAGLEELDRLIVGWRPNPSTYSPSDMRACLDGFRDILFQHLDDEVADLRSENMKKYWKLEEVDRLGI